MGLYLDPLSTAKVRPTIDVDCVVPIENRADFTQLEGRLRQLGFVNATDDDDPLCRWHGHEAIIDVMPFDETILGFGNRFYREGHAAAVALVLAEGMSVWVMPPAIALAAKVEAFEGRGSRDPWSSRDLEDIVLLLEGRASLLDEVRAASPAVRSRLGQWARGFAGRADCADLVDAHLSPGPLSVERADQVLARLRALAALSAP